MTSSQSSELLSRIELPTSSLPRKCSTTELQQLNSVCVFQILKPISFAKNDYLFSARKVPHILGTFKNHSDRKADLRKSLYRKGLFFNFSFKSLLKVSFTTYFQLKSRRRVSNPQPPAWKAGALPIELLLLGITMLIQILIRILSPFQLILNPFLWGEKDSNLRSFRNGFTVRPIWPLWYLPYNKKRAEEGTRTPDLLITNQWLYQLSYFGFLFLYSLKNVPSCKIGSAKVIKDFNLEYLNRFFLCFFIFFF